MKRLKRTPGQTDVRLNSSTRQLASDPRSQTAEPQNNKCDVAASCPHSILVKRLECCADRLNPPPFADVPASYAASACWVSADCQVVDDLLERDPRRIGFSPTAAVAGRALDVWPLSPLNASPYDR